MPPDEWAKLREEIAAQIPLLFELGRIVLGEKEVRRQMQAVLARPRGAPKGSRSPEKDTVLLWLYDALYDAREAASPIPNIKSLPRYISTVLNDKQQGKYGASREAIEKHLRGLLKDRRELLKDQPRRGLINRPS